MAPERSALLIDWGGVLTTNLFASFHDYCVKAEIDPKLLLGRFRTDPRRASCSSRSRPASSTRPGSRSASPRCSRCEPDGLIDGLFAGVEPDTAMVHAVRWPKNAGIRTGLISNSWGVHRYPHDLFDELFDGVVISAEEGIRKPAVRMYELGAERTGVRPAGRRLRG